MAGIRAQYFEDLEEIAGKAKLPAPDTPGEKLLKMLVGDEETLNGLAADKWEKIAGGKRGERLVIGRTSQGKKVCITVRSMKGTKLVTKGFTLEGTSTWAHFRPSTQDYVLNHPDLDVGHWTEGTAQKQLFGKANKRDGETLHGRWLARIWRHVFPNADIEGDNGSMSATETPKQGRAPRGENAETDRSTSAGGRKKGTRASNLKGKSKEEAESGEDDGSENEEPGEDKRGVDNKLLEKYGCSNAKELWQAFEKKSERFELRERGILSLLLRGWRVVEGVEDNRAPDLETLEDARKYQMARHVPLISDTAPFTRWRRRMQAGAKKKEDLDVEELPNWIEGKKQEQREAEERMQKEKEAKERETKEEDAVPEGYERILSKRQEDFLRSSMAKTGFNWTGSAVLKKGSAKILRECSEASGADLTQMARMGRAEGYEGPRSS
ncbi:hypothetical protein KC356_g1942 [Hortaea werneckii]|nr:hypothetical protein KC356_g1942 [Hortaea werneckii]